MPNLARCERGSHLTDRRRRCRSKAVCRGSTDRSPANEADCQPAASCTPLSDRGGWATGCPVYLSQAAAKVCGVIYNHSAYPLLPRVPVLAQLTRIGTDEAWSCTQVSHWRHYCLVTRVIFGGPKTSSGCVKKVSVKADNPLLSPCRGLLGSSTGVLFEAILPPSE